MEARGAAKILTTMKSSTSYHRDNEKSVRLHLLPHSTSVIASSDQPRVSVAPAQGVMVQLHQRETAQGIHNRHAAAPKCCHFGSTVTHSRCACGIPLTSCAMQLPSQQPMLTQLQQCSKVPVSLHRSHVARSTHCSMCHAVSLILAASSL